MKKFNLVAAAIAGTMILSSCGSSVKNVALKTDVDSISYAFGVANTDGLKQYLSGGNMKMDTTQMEAFIKGLLDAKKELTAKEKAYNAGLQIGAQIKDQMLPQFTQMVFGGDTTKTLNNDAFYDGFVSAVNAKGLKMTLQEATTYADAAVARIKAAESEKNFGANKAIGKAFLDSIKGTPGVTATASGLLYQVIKEGTGAKPTADSKVKVHYHGTLIDGTVFDSSVDRGTPAEFTVSQVIPGWIEGLQLMSVGSKYKFYIPESLAYGARDMGTIKPFSTLVFEVELLEIQK